MRHEDEISAIVQQVKQWDLEERRALIKELILHMPPQRKKRPTFSRAYGIARGDGPSPSDEDVKRWIQEYRMEKYGS